MTRIFLIVLTLAAGACGHRYDIALPGERVRLDDGVVVVNGKPIQTERLGPTQRGLFAREGDPTPLGQCPWGRRA